MKTGQEISKCVETNDLGKVKIPHPQSWEVGLGQFQTISGHFKMNTSPFKMGADKGKMVSKGKYSSPSQ